MWNLPPVVTYHNEEINKDFAFIIGGLDTLIKYLENLEMKIFDIKAREISFEEDKAIYYEILAIDRYKTLYKIEAVEGEGYFRDRPIRGVAVAFVHRVYGNTYELLEEKRIFPPQAYKLGEEVVNQIIKRNSEREKELGAIFL